MLKYSFEPIYNKQTEILILGSLPGEKSLQEQRYYAHPQNVFWKILATIYSPEFLTDDFQKQKKMLLLYRLGLWDLVMKAQRKGSLDSELRDIQINNVLELQLQLPNLKKVVFNGNTAYQLYKKEIPFLEFVEYHIMPSTSPANAKMNYTEKLNCWKEVLIQ